MNQADLRALKIPLIALVLTIAVGVGLIYYSDDVLKQARTGLKQQQTQLREAKTRLQKSGDERDVIVQYLGGYQNLQKLGFAGPEQRINWLDGLRLANQQLQLFGVDYQIGTQQVYPYTSELDPGQLGMYQSIMKINLGLLHEGDLMRFLGTLAKLGAGVFSVNECIIARQDTGGVIRYQANLRAQCELAWITVRPAGPGDKKP